MCIGITILNKMENKKHIRFGNNNKETPQAIILIQVKKH